MFGEEAIMKSIKSYFLLMTFLIVLVSGQTIYADTETPIVVDGDVYTWTETVDMQVNKNDDNSITVIADTNESEEMYNYMTLSSIFSNAYEQEVYKSEYAGISIDVENVKDEQVYLNFSLTDIDNNQLVLKEDAFVMKVTENQKVVEKVKFSAVAIEAGFKGKINIPLEMFENASQNQNDFDFAKLVSWSIGVLIEGKASVQMDINGLAWLDNNYLSKYEHSFNTYIEGPENVQIPEHGESIAFFNIVSNEDSTYKFETTGFLEGITLDNNGKITLTTSATEQDIIIKATDDAGISVYKKVTLSNSWREGEDEFFFYGPEEMESISYAFEDVSESDVDFIRIVIIASCGIVFVGYVIFYIKYILDKKREENE